MEPLPQNLIDEINGLDELHARKVRERYAHLLADVPKCRSAGILRMIIAYRLQAEHYGIKLSDECRKWMEEDSPGAVLGYKGKSLGSGAHLVRYWKGEKYEVLVREDGKFEHNGVVFKSLSAIARAITGTQWNGKIFFGVK